MQSTDVGAAATGPLARLFNLGSDELSDPRSDSPGQFLDTLGAHARGILTDAGIAAEALAGLDNRALATQLLALTQGRMSADQGSGLSPEGSEGLLQSLLKRLGAQQAGDLEDELGLGPKLEDASVFGALPAFVLQQLTQAGELDGGLGLASIRDTTAGFTDRASDLSGAGQLSAGEGLGVNALPKGSLANGDGQSVVARGQTLDLTKLLRPGGESRLADYVKWGARGRLDVAEIKLHPPSLGTLDVRVSMDGDKASVQFFTPHPIVKEVLDAAMPKLRDALSQDGVFLEDVGVFQQASGEGQRSAKGQDAESEADQVLGLDADEPSEEARPVVGALAGLSARHDYFI